MSVDFLRAIQDDAYGRLRADPAFTGVPILLERRGVVANDIDRALNTLLEEGSKLGSCIIVLMPLFRVPFPDERGPAGDVLLTVQVIVKPLIADDTGNGGVGKTAEELAAKVLQVLHLVNFGYGGELHAVPTAIVPSQGITEGDVSYDINFSAKGGAAKPAKVSLPSISPAAGGQAPLEVTLSCITSGASIYYTLDGSYPSSANAAAELYDGPFTIEAEATLRVAAEAADLLQSNVASAQFTDPETS